MTAEPGRLRPNGAAPLWAYPFAQLFAGVPRDQVRAASPLDIQPDHLRPVLAAMLAASPETPRETWKRLTAGRADVTELEAAILRVDPRFAGAADGASRFSLLTVEDLANRPKPEFLVDGHLVAGAFSCLYGPSGGGKTFTALELSLSVAAGCDFLDILNTKHGPSVYVAAEGSAGLLKRIGAWKATHPAAVLGQVRFLIQPVNLFDPIEVSLFIERLKELAQPPSLLTFDTLNRCMVGGDENSARDLGVVIANVDRIRAEIGAHVQVVHHTGKNGESERGSSALRAAVDTMLKLSGEDGILKLECDKQKDHAPFDRWHLKLVPSDDGESCTVQVLDAAGRADGPTAKHLDILAFLDSHFTEEGASASKWQDIARVANSTFYRARKVLLEAGYARKEGQRYVLTSPGRAALAERSRTPTPTSLPTDSHGSGMGGAVTPSHSPPLYGGSGSNPPGSSRDASSGRRETPELLPWQGGDDGGGVL